ncbi:hypothetical protein CFP65_6789 [Kitasatospora sp. MMS16-BH015]|uniref:hypothetical protein n=1 Tax=Kitasatospora sp. MMS16-BH015 TaxID=2018025 RepID=UPI000CA2252C|nr:hypothetical protein [Kitasatospora sp. MMS16-BH015]AUG81427.1 hypothetical protein CFP65_6789 [Kitasatospora sp. MMS16-BH015]
MTLQTPQPPPSALRAVLAALDSEAALRQPAAAALRLADGPLLPAHPLAVHVLSGPGADLHTAPRTGWRFLIQPAQTHPAPTHPTQTHPAQTHPAQTHPAPTHPTQTHPTQTHQTHQTKPDLLQGAPAAGLAHPAPVPAAVAAAEVVETPDGHAFSHFTAGPYLDSTVRALRQAWQLAQASRSRHLPRLLSMPGHYATALWLHHPQPGPATDLLIPLAPAPLGVTAHRVYPAAELLALLERATAPAPLALGVPS